MTQSAIPNLLSLLTFLPLVGAVVVMMMPRPRDLPVIHDPEAEPHAPSVPDDPNRSVVNAVALLFSLLTLLLSVALLVTYHSSAMNSVIGNMQFLEDLKWFHVGSIDVHYRMGVDGVSVMLILLTTFLSTLCIIHSFTVKARLKEFMCFLLILESAMLGVFCALDLVLFYVFWEAMLVPMYFLIGIFGHERRVYAAIKFFIFTFAGSVLMLVAIVALYHASGTLNVLALISVRATGSHNLAAFAMAHPQGMLMMFGAFALAFMIKVPMFPLHTWLPDAHVEAPTAGSVILAGVMLKMGTYGFIRFCLPIFPDQARQAAPIFIILAIIGIVYGSLVSAVQSDAKKLVAYSSVAHLGYVMLGIFTFTRIGMMGALIQNINHGISTPMLFFIVGMMYERRGTRKITEFGGLKMVAPGLATMLLIATLASVAVPFFNGFVGEFPVLLGSWISTTTGHWATALAASGMVFSAIYMLWWFQRLMLGPVTRPLNLKFPDLTRNEWLVLTPLAAVIFWFGLGSSFWTQKMNTTVTYLLRGAGAEDTDLPAVRLYNAVFDRQASQRSHASPAQERAALAWLNAGVDQHSVLRGINPATRPLAAGGTPPAPRATPTARTAGAPISPARTAPPSHGAAGAPHGAPPRPPAQPGHGGPRITGFSR